MQGITPHLWFDTQAVDAATDYCASFPEPRITNIGALRGTPSGEVDVWITPTLSFTGDVCGRDQEAVDHHTAVFPDAGVDAAFNEAISFLAMRRFDLAELRRAYAGGEGS